MTAVLPHLVDDSDNDTPFTIYTQPTKVRRHPKSKGRSVSLAPDYELVEENYVGSDADTDSLLISLSTQYDDKPDDEPPCWTSDLEGMYESYLSDLYWQF